MGIQMKFLSLLAFALSTLTKGVELSVYDIGDNTKPIPNPAVSSCEGDFVFVDGNFEGQDGLVLNAPAYAIVTGDDGKDAKMSTMCNKYYKITNEDNASYRFVVVAAYEDTASDELVIGPTICADVCGDACDSGSSCQVTVEEVVPTFVYTSVETDVPLEASTACVDSTIDWTSGEEGNGSEHDVPAYAILVEDGPVLEEPDCLAVYELVSDKEAIRFVVIAGLADNTPTALSVSATLCAELCQETCTSAENAPCVITASLYVPHVGQKLRVYTPIPNTHPEDITECSNSPGEWGALGEGGHGVDEEDFAYGIYVNSLPGTENTLNTECGATFRMVGPIGAEAFILMTAFEAETSTEIAIGPDTCKWLCAGDDCSLNPESPCDINVTQIGDVPTEEETSTEEATTEEVETTETTEETSTEAPTRGADEIEIFLWDGSCEEVSCGSVDWDSQTLCGSRLLPCFAKVEGALTVIDETLDSQTNGQKIPVECGHLLAIEGRYIHVISIDEESNSNALFIADEDFLGLCPFVCKESKVCAVSELFCAEGIYTDCSCPDDASDTLCQDCDGECQEVLIGSARGALDNEISVFAEAVIVGEEAVGAAREFGIATGFAAAALILM